MLRYIADTGQPYRVTLVYSNRNRAAAAFLDELEDCAPASRASTWCSSSRTARLGGESRHVDADVLREHLAEPLDAYSYMVSGPPAMAEDVGEKVRAAGVPEEQVTVGKFSGY